jgi:hypothetical protein
MVLRSSVGFVMAAGATYAFERSRRVQDSSAHSTQIPAWKR